jgi:integrase
MPEAISLPARTAAIDATLLPNIIELYLTTRLAEGVIAAGTANTYRVQLNPWFAFWSQCRDIHQDTLSPEVLKTAHEWIRSTYRNQKGRQASPMSVYDCFIRLKQVFGWAYQANCTGNVNLVGWCPSIKQPDIDLYFPDLAEVQRMLAAPSGETRLRDVACMAFLLSTAARRFETALAAVDNLEFNTPLTNLAVGGDHRGSVWLRFTKGDAAGEGPGRDVVFCSTAGLLLKAYLRSCNRTSGRIFDLTDSGIGQMIEKHAEAVGLPRLSPHAFRRLFSDHWDETHGDALRTVLKKQLGHSLRGGDVTEKHYITRNRRRIVREIMKYHVSPLDSIQLDWAQFPVHVPS